MSELRLSHSQVSTLNTCGVQHQIEKGFKKPGRPHMSTLGGSAFHLMAEHEMLVENGVEGSFVPEVEDALESAISQALVDSPYTRQEIRVSKKLPKGYSKADYPNGADEKFMLDAIPRWLQTWRLWRKSIPYSIWMIPDTGDSSLQALMPALEVELNFELGGYRVKAFVDAIFQNNLTGDLFPVDWKAGARHISGNQQLGTYKVGIEETFHLPVDSGAFYYAREGQAEMHDLRHWTKERLDVIYRHSGAVIENGLYVPNFESCEYMCSVKDWCPYVDGKWSDQVQIIGVNAT
jgi:hypothetical protein